MTQPTPLSSITSLVRRRRLLGASALVPAILAACSGGAQSAPETAGKATMPPSIPTPEPRPTNPPPSPTPVPFNPLTGLQVADQSLIRRRLVAVKIDNAPEARPPIGLGQADMVYEELAEGGLTRFIAMFLQNEPDPVGPVRSARLTDIYLGEEWNWLLAYAGAGTTTGKLLSQSLVPLFKAPELGEKLDGTPYFRDPKRVVPHNLFVHISQVREDAKKDPGIEPEVEIRPFPFASPPETGPLRTINMPYVPMAAVVWRYDEGANTWKRTMANQPHVDGLTGQQITAENVVIQYAKIFTASNVEPDPAGNPVLDADIRGTNKLRVLHSGQMFEGTWTKEHDRAKTQYQLADGSPMPFRPGRVWIHIVPEDFQASWT
jgi:hypothetical protein